jgi:Holliday junction resolvase RusA-like endonuclease
MVELQLPFPPSVNRIWRKGKYGNIYLSKKYTAWRKQADLTIIEARRKGMGRVAGRFTTSIVLDKRKRRKNTDADNRVKVVLDCLQRMLVIDDDALADKVTVEWGEANGVKVVVKPTYDPHKDFANSLNDGYSAIRERVAAGGQGWKP